MKKIDRGLFLYEITGEREEAAAAAMEQKIAFIERFGGQYAGQDLEELPAKIAKEYNVSVRAV